ncbi:MAG: SDR family NAD(P)-dependent oxidoreductase [Aquimonas sp.]|nr:SDR family NAD(P)-dependent oxidoreductase [Aquimonas sp.]
MQSTQRFYILTGASRGLGRSLARALLKPGIELLCLSRGRDEGLEDAAAAAGGVATQWQVDLAQPAAVAGRLQAWLTERGPDGLELVALVNNAALLEQPGPIESQSPQAIEAGLAVGLLAPMLLSRALLLGSAGWELDRRLLNISSGLGRRPLAGVATYCAVKAGLDHFTRTLAEEQQGQAWPLKAVSLAPGIIDTGMQVQLRGSDARHFAAQPVFENLHHSGVLDSPEAAAAKLVAWLHLPDFGHEAVADIRD